MTATTTKTEMHRLGRDSNLKVGDVVYQAFKGERGLPSRVYEVTIAEIEGEHPLFAECDTSSPVFASVNRRVVRDNGVIVDGARSCDFISLHNRDDLDAGEFPGYGLFATITEAEHFVKRPRIQLRETAGGFVRVLKDGVEVYRNREYKFSADWAQSTFGLRDNEMLAIYQDYKADYDAI